MVDSGRLLSDLTRLLGDFERDLRRQVEERADVRAGLLADYEAARRVGRTQSAFDSWIEEPITQGAVAWILGTVFARFLEDNALVEPRLSGTGARYTRAVQEHQHYFQLHPTDSERNYLEHLFTALSALPSMEPLFDSRHNPLWRLPLSADAARQLVRFWQRIDPDTGQVAHDFADEALDTRFLGDIYQDLSEPVRKRYALLQTPAFVERFILDRTLTPAIETFGYREVRVIDPTCGSGHFLLGAFERLLALAEEHEPARNVRSLVADSLSRVVGIDINPYAVAIARFRLTVAALRACGITRLAAAPGFDIPVVVADSLLHGPRFAEDGAIQMSVLPDDPSDQYYFAEDEPRVKALLGRQYHAVVGNPPYITVKDAALNLLYRERYRSCHRQYALVVPFMERLFELALRGGDSAPGFVGMIVANSFMKREFGKKLIEQYLPKWDLTHVVDTSGAYIPGHGTPTVILFGRHARPATPTVRVVMGIRGEPSTPEDPAKGLVWGAILDQLDRSGSESTFVSVADLARAGLEQHPWSIGGGGAAELKELLDDAGSSLLSERVAEIGFGAVTREDEVFQVGMSVAARMRIPSDYLRPLVAGEEIRDWTIQEPVAGIWPYSESDLTAFGCPAVTRFLWPWKRQLSERVAYGESQVARGLQWFEYSMFFRERFRNPVSIAFAFVATHNHFVLDRGGKVFNRSAPVIKLPPTATEGDHLALLGLLNSSTACFWMKQVFMNKAGSGIGRGIQPEGWMDRWEFDVTKLQAFPVPSVRKRTLEEELERLASHNHALAIQEDGASGSDGAGATSHVDLATQARLDRLGTETMIGLQEELDWRVYVDFGLADDSVVSHNFTPPLRLGQRAFEIVMARAVARGEAQTTWFERHDSSPVTEIPAEWPDDYRRLVEARIELIENDRYIGLIEQPAYKRRWNVEPFEDRLKRTTRSWLLDRLETPDLWKGLRVTSVARLADRARQDVRFMEVAEVYSGRPDFDVARLVDELVRDESLPFLPVLRYKDTGLRKRKQWEATWDLQRLEDAIDRRVGLPEADPRRFTVEQAVRAKAKEVGEVPVPPKYTSADFKSGTYWRLRGKLDVPKERFVSYPGCERAADGSLPVTWAGWDHAQQARALGDYYMQIKNEEGSASPKLAPLLAGLLELLPWIRQWHAGPDPEFGLDLGDYYAGFVDTEARSLGLTVDAVRSWAPPSNGSKRRRRGGGRDASGE